MNNTINIEEAIETINKQNKRIEELILENERLGKLFYERNEENIKLRKNINNAKKYIEQHRIRQMSMVEVNALEGILNEQVFCR